MVVALQSVYNIIYTLRNQSTKSTTTTTAREEPWDSVEPRRGAIKMRLSPMHLLLGSSAPLRIIIVQQSYVVL